MKKNKFLTAGLFLILLAASAVGIWKTVYISADIDESYAVTMAVRIVKGDGMFAAMWEPHQMSALLYAPLVWIYQSIAGNLDGALVFMRQAGIIIQGLVSVCAYRCFKKKMPTALAMTLAFAYFNFTPKHIQSPEFTVLCYWLLMLLIVCLTSYEQGAGLRSLIFAGLSMSALVLCYPAMLALFAVCALRLFVDGRRSARDADCLAQVRHPAGVFAAVCVLCGAAFLVYLCCTSGIGQALGNISNVLADASHDQSFWQLWKGHILSLWKILQVTLALIVIVQVGRPVLDRKNRFGGAALAALLLLQALWCAVQFHTIRGVNFIAFYPVVLQVFVIGWYAAVYYPHDKGKRDFYRTGLWVNLTGVLCILSSSNLDAVYSMSFLMPSLLMGIAMIWDVFEDSAGTKRKRALCRAAFVCMLAVFLLQLLTARIFLVRFTSTQRKNIFDGYYETHAGVLRSVRLGDFDYLQYEAKLQALGRHVAKEDVFLYVGCDMFLYSALDGAQIGTGNTISTPVFSDQLMRYYAQYPERIPTVVFVDREYVADFSAVLKQQPFQGFMETYFEMSAPVMDGPVTVYYRKEQGR